METHITSLKIRCVRARTNITQLCKDAGVNRQLISKWEKEEPKTLRILRKLDEALRIREQLEKEVEPPVGQ